MNDFGNDRVQRFDDKGAYLLQFGQPGSGNGQLNGPVGIVVHKDKVYDADNNNHRVSVFHLNGQFSLIIGSGQLRNPWDVVITVKDQLLFANNTKHCISRFTLDGTVW